MPQAKASRPRKRRSDAILDRDKVIAAAVKLAEHEGLERLSVRKLGEVLGVTHVALYRYVSSKTELMDLVLLEKVDIDLPGNWPQDWKAALSQYATAFRDFMMAHPRVAGAFQRKSLLGKRYLDINETLYSRLFDAGFTANQIMSMMLTINQFTIGVVNVEQAIASATDGRETMSASLERRMQRLKDLPAESYPASQRMVTELDISALPDVFSTGLQALLAQFECWLTQSE